MATPFKLKSGNASAFKNLGSSPAKQKPGGSVGEALKHHKEYKAKKSMPKNFNMKGSKGSKTPGFSTTKLGKFLSSKAFGVLSLLGAGTLSATATPTENQGKKGSYTSDIQDIIPKKKEVKKTYPTRKFPTRKF